MSVAVVQLDAISKTKLKRLESVHAWWYDSASSEDSLLPSDVGNAEPGILQPTGVATEKNVVEHGECVCKVLLPSLGGGVEVHLVGTAHVSRRSVQQVAQVVHAIRPDVVMVELCQQRLPLLFTTEIHQVQGLRETLEFVRRNGIFPLVYARMLASIAEKMEVLPGAEMQSALLAALRIHKCEGHHVLFCLGDRPLNVTVRRLWTSLFWWQKIRLIKELLMMVREDIGEDDISELMNEHGIEFAMRQLGQVFPTVLTTLVEERNQFLAASVRAAALKAAGMAATAQQMVGKDSRRTCSMCGQEFPSRSAMFRHLKESGRHTAPTAGPLPPIKVVAVIGFGHLGGVQRLLESEQDINIASLMKIEEPSMSLHKTYMAAFLSSSLAALVVFNYFRRNRR